MNAHKHMIVRSSVPSDLARPTGAVTPVLLASSRSDDLEQIPALLPRRQWMLVKVTSWSHVLQVVSAVTLPIVLCDREIPGLEWPEGLAQLSAAFRRPALILLSDLTADSLWQDVIRYGGFDMLFRPLCQDRLVTALEMARIQWELRVD
jgi:AmiR/NasT family two-component response regulator